MEVFSTLDPERNKNRGKVTSLLKPSISSPLFF